MVALSWLHFQAFIISYGWVGGDIIIIYILICTVYMLTSVIKHYIMSDCQQNQFKKLKSSVISGRSVQSEDKQ